MKNIYISLTIFSIFLFAACGQNKANNTDSMKEDSIKTAVAKYSGCCNFVDNSGKRQGYWIYTNSMPGYNLNGYASNAKVDEGNYKDNLKQGEWTRFNPDGSIKSKTNYVNDSIEKVEDFIGK